MTSQFKQMSGLVPATYQGSWALHAPAEKVCSSHQSARFLTNLVGPSNLAILRLDGWNPHEQRVRQPPNLANLHASAHMRTYARIRVRRVFAVIATFHKTLKQVGLVGRLAKPASMRVSAVQPFSQPLEVGLFQTQEDAMTKASLREEMPQVAELIDRFRKTFGRTNIDDVIRRGIKGDPVFYASENGHTIGTNWPDPMPAVPVVVDPSTESNRDRHYRETRERYQAMMADGPAVQTSTQTSAFKGRKR